MMSPAAVMWAAFVERLAEIQPIGQRETKGRGGKSVVPHTNFLGSVKAYKKIFMEANETRKEVE